MISKEKCTICTEPNNFFFRLNETILGKELYTVINNLCNEELYIKDNLQHDIWICAECVADLIHVNKVVNKVRVVFKKIQKKNSATVNEAVKTNEEQGAVKNIENDKTEKLGKEPFIFMCAKCSFQSDKVRLFKKHSLECHNETETKPYRCTVCNVKYTRHDNYFRHFNTKHAIKEEALDFEDVDDGNVDAYADEKGEEEESKLQKVVNIPPTNTQVIFPSENGTDVFQCPECVYKTENIKLYRKHRTKVHNVQKDQILKCVECNKSYQRVDHYKQHMEFQHKIDGSVGILCKICQRRCQNISSLTLHMRLHSENDNTDQTIVDRTIVDGAIATSTPLDSKTNNTVLSGNLLDTVKKNKKRALEVELTNETPLKKKADLDLNNSKETKFKKLQDTEEASTCEEEAPENNEIKTEVEFDCAYCHKKLSSFKKMQKHYSRRHADEIMD